VATYSSLPHQIDTWFKAWKKAKEMIGNSGTERRIPLAREVAYLDSYVRGVYAKRDLQKGQLLSEEDIYLAIPLQKGQISSRELMLGKYGHRLMADCSKDKPITIDELDTPYSESEDMRKTIYNRGL
jgi:N-acetylneuraminate synthase